MVEIKFIVFKRLRSFIYALNGLRIILKEEHNARIHLLAALFVVALSIAFNINRIEWAAIILCFGFVFAFGFFVAFVFALVIVIK